MTLVTKISLVRNAKQASENIVKFQREVLVDDDVNVLVDTLSHFRAWYAMEYEGDWIFGPSKFIGYENMDVAIYENNNHVMDGRQTELVLGQWFEPVKSDLQEELETALHDFLSNFGKRPSKLARISVQQYSNKDAMGMVEALLGVYRALPEHQQKEFRRRLN